MTELVELLKALPLPALLVFAAVLAVIVGVRFAGVWQGIRGPSVAAETKAQVAAVIVDPSALLAATAALEANTVEKHEANMIAKRQADATEDMVRAIGALRDQMVFLAAQMK